ncbi:hypothetical protein J6590_018962 [Homalodisca vitripennis]|nr:hypothetical protein J6590_018962 [Homalodisca vitripennis]
MEVVSSVAMFYVRWRLYLNSRDPNVTLSPAEATSRAHCGATVATPPTERLFNVVDDNPVPTHKLNISCAQAKTNFQPV